MYQEGVLRVRNTTIATQRPFETLRAHFARETDRAAAHFQTGFIGCFGYGLQHTLERLSPSPREVTGLPVLCGGDYGWSVVTDHAERTTNLWHDSTCSAADVRAIAQRLTSRSASPTADFSIGPRFTSSMRDRDYFDAFDVIKHYLAADECYQVNLRPVTT